MSKRNSTNNIQDLFSFGFTEERKKAKKSKKHKSYDPYKDGYRGNPMDVIYGAGQNSFRTEDMSDTLYQTEALQRFYDGIVKNVSQQSQPYQEQRESQYQQSRYHQPQYQTYQQPEEEQPQYNGPVNDNPYMDYFSPNSFYREPDNSGYSNSNSRPRQEEPEQNRFYQTTFDNSENETKIDQLFTMIAETNTKLSKLEVGIEGLGKFTNSAITSNRELERRITSLDATIESLGRMVNNHASLITANSKDMNVKNNEVQSILNDINDKITALYKSNHEYRTLVESTNGKLNMIEKAIKEIATTITERNVTEPVTNDSVQSEPVEELIEEETPVITKPEAQFTGVFSANEKASVVENHDPEELPTGKDSDIDPDIDTEDDDNDDDDDDDFDPDEFIRELRNFIPRYYDDIKRATISAYVGNTLQKFRFNMKNFEDDLSHWVVNEEAFNQFDTVTNRQEFNMLIRNMYLMVLKNYLPSAIYTEEEFKTKVLDRYKYVNCPNVIFMHIDIGDINEYRAYIVDMEKDIAPFFTALSKVTDLERFQIMLRLVDLSRSPESSNATAEGLDIIRRAEYAHPLIDVILSNDIDCEEIPEGEVVANNVCEITTYKFSEMSDFCSREFDELVLILGDDEDDDEDDTEDAEEIAKIKEQIAQIQATLFDKASNEELVSILGKDNSSIQDMENMMNNPELLTSLANNMMGGDTTVDEMKEVLDAAIDEKMVANSEVNGVSIEDMFHDIVYGDDVPGVTTYRTPKDNVMDEWGRVSEAEIPHDRPINRNNGQPTLIRPRTGGYNNG